jgi:vacuolar-type H+-ATPase subunit E/Vma4
MESVTNGKQALISGIEKDAKSEAESIVAEAEKQAEERRKNIGQQVSSILNDAEKKAEQQMEAIQKKVLSGVDVEVKRRLMHLRDKVMKDILGSVQKDLRALITKPEYRDIIQNWIVEAAAGLGAEQAVINVSKEERALLDRKFIEKTEKRIKGILGFGVMLNVSEGQPLRGQGVVLTAQDGRTAFNNQVHTRMMRKQREIRKYIYDNVFSEEL